MILALLIAAGLIFHPRTIAQVVAENPCDWKQMRTHVEVSGFVTYKKHEEDGDWHLRLCEAPEVKGMDRKRCIVAEIIPALPLPPPRRGQSVRVKGITRYDAESGHGWWELHPVLSLEQVP